MNMGATNLLNYFVTNKTYVSWNAEVTVPDIRASSLPESLSTCHLPGGRERKSTEVHPKVSGSPQDPRRCMAMACAEKAPNMVS